MIYKGEFKKECGKERVLRNECQRWRRLVGDSEEGFDGGLKAREAASSIHYGHD